MKVRYLGHPQTIMIGSVKMHLKPGDIITLEDPDKALRGKNGRRLWEQVEAEP